MKLDEPTYEAKTLAHAIALASNLFQNTYDKGGSPYILHCLRVMNKVSDLGYNVMAAAVLHDVIEDTAHNAQTLYNLGFPEEVVSLVEMVTFYQDDDYIERIHDIATDYRATRIKMADLEDNSDITRLKGLREKDMLRIRKYHEAYTILKSSITVTGI